MSQILQIYDSIDDMVIPGVKSRNLKAIKLAIRKSDLPCRMLLPNTEADLEFVAIGTLANLTWVVRDLCLWAPLSAGTGVAEFSEAMVEYMASYIAKIKANRNPTSYSNITGVAFQLGPVPWGDNTYWAVDITLTITEIL